MRINTYNIYLKKDKDGSIEDLLLIKKGFNIYALIFNMFWFIYKRLWLEAGFLFVVFTFFNLLDFYTSIMPSVVLCIAFGFCLYMAFEANERYEAKIKKDGYEIIGNSYGRNESEAKSKILEDLQGKYELSENFQVF